MFPIGQLVATPGALAFCKQHGINPIHIIARHVARDWSQMDREDQAANLAARSRTELEFSAHTSTMKRAFGS